MIDTYLYFILGVILGQITFSTILLILEDKHKERKEWEEWKNKLP